MTNRFQTRLAVILFLTAMVSLTLSGIYVYTLYQRAFLANTNVVESFQTIRAANRILLAIDEATLNVSSFIITDQANYIKKLPELIVAIRLNIQTLAQLTNDNATEMKIINDVGPLVEKKIHFLNQTMSDYISRKKTSRIKLAIDSNRLALSNSIYQGIDTIKKIEIGQLDEAMPEYELHINIANKIFIILGVINILILLSAYGLARSVRK